MEVIDSESVTMGEGLLAIAAAESAAAGGALDKLIAETRDRMARTRVYGVVGSLEHLQKGGRIGGAQALLGSILSIKPVIQVKDGVVAEESKQRTRSRSLRYLANKVQADRPFDRMAVCSGAAPDIDQLVAMLEGAAPAHPLLTVDLGPVVGTHAGPGTVGICYQLAPGDPEHPTPEGRLRTARGTTCQEACEHGGSANLALMTDDEGQRDTADGGATSPPAGAGPDRPPPTAGTDRAGPGTVATSGPTRPVGTATGAASAAFAAEWPVKAVDAIDGVVGTINDRALRPIIVVARAIVFGLLIAVLGLVVLVMVSVGLIRLLDVYVFPGKVWASYALLGSVFTGIGLWAWSRRSTPTGQSSGR